MGAYFSKSGDNQGLINAAKRGEAYSVESLIKAGVDVNTYDSQGKTPLIYAAINGDLDCIKVLIENGVDVNAQANEKTFEVGDQMTALMYAVQQGNHECIDTLVRAGADVNGHPNAYVTTLMLAAGKGHNKCVRKLILAGADVNLTGLIVVTALILALRMGWTKCVRLLIEAGADVNKADELSNTPLISVLRVHHVNSQGYIIEENKITCLQLLLKAGAHVNQYNCDNRYAISTHFQDAFLVNKKVLMLLLAAGETLNCSPTLSASQSLDAEYLHVEVPEYLAKGKAHLNLKHQCREAIRKQLLQLSPVNLFVQIPQLRLPQVITSYLLYHMTLDN